MEITQELTRRFDEASQSDRAEPMLCELILDLRREGLTEDEARALLYSITVQPFDTDDLRVAAICNVLDVVGGYCSPSAHIFGPDFDELSFRHIYRI